MKLKYVNIFLFLSLFMVAKSFAQNLLISDELICKGSILDMKYFKTEKASVAVDGFTFRVTYDTVQIKGLREFNGKEVSYFLVTYINDYHIRFQDKFDRKVEGSISKIDGDFQLYQKWDGSENKTRKFLRAVCRKKEKLF